MNMNKTSLLNNLLTMNFMKNKPKNVMKNSNSEMKKLLMLMPLFQKEMKHLLVVNNH